MIIEQFRCGDFMPLSAQLAAQLSWLTPEAFRAHRQNAQVKRIAGIMNGTTNYILSRMAAEGVIFDFSPTPT